MKARLRSPAILPNPGTAGVGIIHALARGGVNMITVGRAWPPLLGRLSRFPKRHITYDPKRGETLADALLRASACFDGKGVLFPGIDVDLEAIIAARDRLADRFHIPATRDVDMRILDKDWQYALARKVGVPVPRCAKILGGESPDVTGFRFPLIVKPCVRTESAAGPVFRLRVLPDRDALDRCVDELTRRFPDRKFQIAEDIPGAPEQLVTVGSYSNRSGQVLRSYTGRKVSQHPYTHGDASIAESIDLPKQVVRQARELLEAGKIHGITQVEFKFDARDGLHKLLEINGRTWSWVKLAAFSGVNLPLIQYYDLTKDPRLGDALRSPQDNGYFFVREALVALNGLPVERDRIRELNRRKQRVPAVTHPGELRLNLAYRIGTAVQRLRGNARGTSSTNGS